MKTTISVSITLLLFVLLFSCQHNKYTIEGYVENELFWNNKVYLVALDAPITKNVDSSIIQNGRFVFQGNADSLKVAILRVPSQIPNYLEDLIVILEPGKINANLSTNSFSYGTKLNDSLQEWKNNKITFDSIQWNMWQTITVIETDQIKKDSIKLLLNIKKDSFVSDNIRFIKENAKNGIGLLLFKLYYHDIPADEKNEIISKVGNLYVENDKELKLRILQ